ncbi:MAG: nucleotidyltransferase substrate binding protein [Pseudomonadota bacterium]|nr:nucleotidyltransferase substrate binding protein [Pseudomonadota bacterium]
MPYTVKTNSAEERVWLDMIEMRNLSSHVYDEQEVSKILTELDRYLAAFEAIQTRLSKTLAPTLNDNQADVR